MQTWGKGMVWVNGHAMRDVSGKSVPADFVYAGLLVERRRMKIIVLTWRDRLKQSGWRKNRFWYAAWKAPETHRKDGQNLNLKAESSKCRYFQSWKRLAGSTVLQPAAGRYFCLEGISNYEGNNIAAIAELDVLDNNGKPVSRENWKIVYADSEETRSGNRTADKVFDLQESTFWQTVDNTAYPSSDCHRFR